MRAIDAQFQERAQEAAAQIKHLFVELMMFYGMAIGMLGMVAKVGRIPGVYRIRTPGKPYIGQGVNMERRVGQHVRTGKTTQEMAKEAEVLKEMPSSTKLAREIEEHRQIMKEGIQNLENIRYPIGPRREYLLPPDVPPHP